jgi:AraC family transcriptional regulator
MQTSALRTDHLALSSNEQEFSRDSNINAIRFKDAPKALKLRAGRATQRHHRAWTNASATVDDLRSDGMLELEVVSLYPTLVMALEEIGRKVEFFDGTESNSASVCSRAEVVSFVPGNVKAFSTSSETRYLRLLTLEFEKTFWDKVHIPGESGSRLDVPRFMFADPLVAKLCRLIAQECVGPECCGRQYADNLISALAIALARAETTGKALSRGGLAPWQLRRVQSHMLENLAGRVTLRQLAEIAQISLTHFSRAFKESVGCAPHQWMIEAKMDEAKKLLMVGAMSLTEVSLTLGFCDQAHFTRVFTKSISATPLAWQRSHQG